jgi:hypothetical protein
LHEGAVVSAIVVLGAVARAATTSVQSFWIDELFTTWLVRMSFGDMLRNLGANEASPQLYYVIAWTWTRVFGQTEVALRSLSVLAGCTAIPLAYLVARRLWTREVATWAAVLVALNPFLVWYGQEGRSYALLVPLAMGLGFFFVAVLQEPSRGHLAGWALTSGVAVAIHYFALILVIPTAVWLLVDSWRTRRAAVVAAVGVPALVTLSLAPLALHQRVAVGDPGGVTGTSLVVRLAAVPKNFLVGYTPPAELAVTMISGGLMAAALVLSLRVGRGGGGVALMLGLGSAAALTPTVLAMAGADYVTSRNLIPVLVPVLLVAAVGVGSSRTGRAVGVGLCVVSIVVIASVAVDPLRRRQEFRGAAEAIGPTEEVRALVGPPEFENVGPVGTYFGTGQVRRNGTVTVTDIAVVALPAVGRYGVGVPTPPRDRPRPPPSGFALIDHREERAFTLARYAARRPTRVSVSRLRDLMFPPDPGVVVIQRAEGRSHSEG